MLFFFNLFCLLPLVQNILYRYIFSCLYIQSPRTLIFYNVFYLEMKVTSSGPHYLYPVSYLLQHQPMGTKTVGENSGSEVGAKAHAYTFNTHTVTPTCCCPSVGPTHHLSWITNGIIWILEHDSGLKLVHHRAVSLENHRANVLHSQNEAGPFLWTDLIKLKWLVWLILYVTLEGWTK